MATTRSAQTQQGFPQITAPLTINGGFCNQPWYQLFITLWNRTGGGQGAGASPPGQIASFAASIPPNGWLLCEGQEVSRDTYSTLFAVIGETWGSGDGSSTFNVPDLRGRFIVGTSGSHALASTGGQEEITLTVGQLPSHTHAVNDPGHFHTSLVADSTNTTGTDPGSSVAGNTGTSVTGITLDNTGSGDSVPTIPPYAAIVWIIKF